MCVNYATRFQNSDRKAPVFHPGDVQVIPFGNVVGKIDFPDQTPLDSSPCSLVHLFQFTGEKALEHENGTQDQDESDR